MVTLTTPPQLNSVLGGNSPVGYDKLVLSPIRFFPVEQRIEATMVLTSTASPDMPPVSGTLAVDGSTLAVTVTQLDFYRRVKLSAGQLTAVRQVVADAQNALESGLVSLSIVSGVQAAGV